MSRKTKRKAIKLSAFSLFRIGRIILRHLSIFPQKSFMRNVFALQGIAIINGTDNSKMGIKTFLYSTVPWFGFKIFGIILF